MIFKVPINKFKKVEPDLKKPAKTLRHATITKNWVGACVGYTFISKNKEKKKLIKKRKN